MTLNILLTNQFRNHESGFSWLFDQFDEFLQVLGFFFVPSARSQQFWQVVGTLGVFFGFVRARIIEQKTHQFLQADHENYRFCTLSVLEVLRGHSNIILSNQSLFYSKFLCDLLKLFGFSWTVGRISTPPLSHFWSSFLLLLDFIISDFDVLSPRASWSKG